MYISVGYPEYIARGWLSIVGQKAGTGRGVGLLDEWGEEWMCGLVGEWVSGENGGEAGGIDYPQVNVLPEAV